MPIKILILKNTFSEYFKLAHVVFLDFRRNVSIYIRRNLNAAVA